MKEKSFLILPLSEYRIRLRNIFKLKGHTQISDFVVQLEAKIESGRWVEVVRYDLVHGYFHRDLIYANGHRKKDRIMVQGLHEATLWAVEDLKQNMENHLRITGYNMIADKNAR